jgi:diguanylate cyclase (GGDEF)-like protein
LDALEQDKVDLLMASEYMLITQSHYREKAGFKINLRLSTPLETYFGFNKDEEILRNIISKAQQFVQTDVIAHRWKNRSFDYSKKFAEEQVFYARIFGGVVSFLFLASLFLLIRTIRLEKKLVEFASKDALTDIYNRRYFMELATIHIERSFRMSSSCFVVIYDLDHFKLVNDKYGHLAGDKVLKETAARIKKTIRPYDLFGRYGGEEFILVMSDVDEKNVFNAVERLRQKICAAPVEYENLRIPISASFGISSATPPTDINEATKHADEALYRAKEGGRNRVVVHREDHMSLFGITTVDNTAE